MTASNKLGLTICWEVVLSQQSLRPLLASYKVLITSLTTTTPLVYWIFQHYMFNVESRHLLNSSVQNALDCISENFILSILDPSAYGFGNARKLWETLRRSSQNLAIWASQRMIFDPTKTFCFFYICFIAKVLCYFGITTEEVLLTALKNFQVSKAPVNTITWKSKKNQ